MRDNKVLINLTNLALTASGDERTLLVAQHKLLAEAMQSRIAEKFTEATEDYQAAQKSLDALAIEIGAAEKDVKRIVGVIEKVTRAVNLLTKLVDKVI